MNTLRGLLFDNLGLKLVALLLALMVYLNVYTERPASMVITFPVQITDLPDSLALSGPVLAAVQAELRGRAKQLIRLRVTEPAVRISLAGARVGRYERALGVEDLALPPGVEVTRMVSLRMIELEIDRKVERSVPVAARVEGEPAEGGFWDGAVRVRPPRVTVRGPAGAVEALDSVRVRAVSIAGRRDTVVASLPPQSLPEGCETRPPRVEVVVPLEPGVTRRLVVPVEPSRGRQVATPDRVVAVISAPRRLASRLEATVRATWSPAEAGRRGGKVALRVAPPVPEGVRVRFEPDSVSVRPQVS